MSVPPTVINRSTVRPMTDDRSTTDRPTAHRVLARRRWQLVLAVVTLLVDAVLLARRVRAYRAAYQTAWAASWGAACDEAIGRRERHRPTDADR